MNFNFFKDYNLLTINIFWKLNIIIFLYINKKNKINVHWFCFTMDLCRLVGAKFKPILLIVEATKFEKTKLVIII